MVRWTGKESSTVYKDYQYRRFVGMREGRAYERRRRRRRLWVGEQADSKKAKSCGRQGVEEQMKEQKM